MLDLNHPLSGHIFRASSLIDEVMRRGQQMSVSPSPDRFQLLAECLPLFAQLRQLNLTQFGYSTSIANAIDEYEDGIRQLAELGNGQITDDRRDGSGNCSVCGTAIAHYPEFSIVLCDWCDRLFMPAKEKLCSFEGFGTDAI